MLAKPFWADRKNALLRWAGLLLAYGLSCAWLMPLRGGASGMLFDSTLTGWLLAALMIPLAWSLYYCWSQPKTSVQIAGWLLLGTVHLYFIAASPQLSDDVYRFIWDGRLLAAGQHPFAHTPGWYLEHPGHGLPGINEELFLQLNSPNYFTIYPPLNQLIFWFSALGSESIGGSIIIIRSFVLLAGLGSVALLWRLLPHYSQPRELALVFALHPMALLEFTLNLHFEVFVIFFLLLSLWYHEQGRWPLSALALALSVVSKLLPLLWLPLLFYRLGWKKAIAFYLICGGVVVLSFLPLLNLDLLLGMRESVGLYFQKFEFNASVYYLIRWLGYELTGFNIIQLAGPVLAMTTFVGIVLFTFLERGRLKLPEAMLWTLGLYLLFTTTVHPWYISTMLVLGLLSGYYWPLLWSLLVFLTYAGYTETGYELNWLLIWIEYGAVIALMLWELWRRPHLKQNPYALHLYP